MLSRPSVVLIVMLCSFSKVVAQQSDILSYVDPFIGTSDSDVFTKWGKEGGTYPGAVAPFGYFQCTPETSIGDRKGYHYTDDAVYFFSCINHYSGYPNGSAGQIKVMPLREGTCYQSSYRRPFSHTQEHASPGYYKMVMSDDSTVVETTASPRCGVFRFTFPRDSSPVIYIGGVGEINTADNKQFEGEKFNTLFSFSEDAIRIERIGDGYQLTFRTSGAQGRKTITLKLSTSAVSIHGAQSNLASEVKEKTFDETKSKTQDLWREALSVVEIDDGNTLHKTIFYTALYHSLLLPWIISDADKHYRGRDGKIHVCTGDHEYDGFSPWDTYRTLHPLLTLLFPERQNDMMLSMLDIFDQTGHLPTDPMTGNHAVPVIVDSYLKGIKTMDSTIVYRAMRGSIDIPPFVQKDLEVYQRYGYLPLSDPESVTRTVEYSYDDWTLAQFARRIMHSQVDSERLLTRSYGYRNLFYPPAMSLIPRQENEFKVKPGNFGYKEGDQWVYSYAVPHHAGDLINLMGGRDDFVARLDSMLRHQAIIFDNETMLHVPYLFHKAGHPEKTWAWTRELMETRYHATPGGLPGNDDLGSMSSWYVFSALGIFPVLPGDPVYEVGSPLFRSVTLHLPNGRDFVIRSENNAEGKVFVHSLKLNEVSHRDLFIPHETILKGGQLKFEMSDRYARWFHGDEQNGPPLPFKITSSFISRKEVKPGEPLSYHFSITNTGHDQGTAILKLKVDGKVQAHKNIVVPEGKVLHDSIVYTLYKKGKTKLKINGGKTIKVTVVDAGKPMSEQLRAKKLIFPSTLMEGDRLYVSCAVQNIGGESFTFHVPASIDGVKVAEETVKLEPGEEKEVSFAGHPVKEGLHTITIGDLKDYFKVFNRNKNSTVLDLEMNRKKDDSLFDASGFNNHAHVTRMTSIQENVSSNEKLNEDVLIDISPSHSLDVMGSTITMMAWLYTNDSSRALTDLLTKGDHHVLQVQSNKLNFFAGGWGRGECSTDLPSDWTGKWHHIAGVCDGKRLMLYIDGVLKNSTILENEVNLSAEGRWRMGRNEEFPGERIFSGYMDKIRIFSAPLSAQEILSLVEQEAYMRERVVKE
jgi:putative alpha-1,2-mannosidase